MKRFLPILTVVAICSAMTLSCKNGKTNEQVSSDAKISSDALTDSVMAIIDELAIRESELYGRGYDPLNCVLTDQEKLVKPDYLLDLDKILTLVTRQQKANALGILTTNLVIRKIYDLPMDQTKEAIGRLAADLNIPFNTGEINDQNLAEKRRNAYETMKENGDLDLYWQWLRASLISSNYIISRNPGLFLDKVTTEKWETFHDRADCLITACVEFASVDSTFAPLVVDYKQRLDSPKNNSIKSSIETAKEMYIQRRAYFEAKYDSLLQ